MAPPSRRNRVGTKVAALAIAQSAETHFDRGLYEYDEIKERSD
jgi:hypothetical protein